MGEELRESWFTKPRVSEAPAGVVRSRRATFVLGAIVGGLGGAAALACAGMLAGHAAPAWPLLATTIATKLRAPMPAGFAVGAVAGALLGGAFAVVMRHAPRFVARLVFASAFGAALWFCVHVELATHHRATLPLVPMLVGMCVHGAFVACVPPARRA